MTYEILSHNYEILSHNYEMLSHNYEILSQNVEILSPNYAIASHYFETFTHYNNIQDLLFVPVAGSGVHSLESLWASLFRLYFEVQFPVVRWS